MDSGGQQHAGLATDHLVDLDPSQMRQQLDNEPRPDQSHCLSQNPRTAPGTVFQGGQSAVKARQTHVAAGVRSLRLRARTAQYRVDASSYTELLARWILVPVRPGT
ncbi:hypothetical protein [Cryptosporangium arvum]|uniref:hypothetical protein n=1 Tax=Cryptosporangium arvum TaxID=80871 RepID=UPI0004B3C277|nr:hypothetical protein [Cryptosporangium arvum]